jgi:hypothetical protein
MQYNMHHKGRKELPMLWKIGAFPDRLSRRKQEMPDQIQDKLKLSTIRLKSNFKALGG